MARLRGLRHALSALAVAAALAAPALGAPETKLSTPGSVGDSFGAAVAVDGDTVVIGAPDDSGQAGAAYVYVRCNGVLRLQQRLVPDTGAPIAQDLYGFSVAVHGQTLIVGAPGRSGGGAVYVFTRTGSVWTQGDVLTASDAGTNPNGAFGEALDIEGDTLVVGAKDNGGAASSAGAAYVFARSGGAWLEQQRLEASDAAANDAFGTAVALSGDVAVVGAPGHDGAADSAGAAYVFVRTGTQWDEARTLTAFDAGVSATFGSSVALDGPTLVVGAPGEASLGALTGAAYIFSGAGSFWVASGKLVAHDAAAGAAFAAWVAVRGSSLAIGAPNESVSGSVYVFSGRTNRWAHVRKVVASDRSGANLFGRRVAMNAESLVVGSSGAGSDAAYVVPVEARILASDGAVDDLFGTAVAASGDTAIVGASGAGGTGAAYLLERDGDLWVEDVKLVPNGGNLGDEFGTSVAIHRDTAVVGASRDAAGGPATGAAFVTTRKDGVWSDPVRIVGDDLANGDAFGASVAVYGDTVVVGAPSHGAAGAVYVFTRSGESWSQAAKLEADPPAAPAARFGSAVAVSVRTLLVGAPRDDGEAGAAFVYVFDGADWMPQQKLSADAPSAGDQFGSTLSLDHETCVLGAPLRASAAGAAYVFVRSSGAWNQQARLEASDGSAGDQFGSAVGVARDTVIVGARLVDGLGQDTGAAYVFARQQAVWTETERLPAPGTREDDQLGASVAASGQYVLAGMPFSGDRGAVAVFPQRGDVWAPRAKLVSSVAAGGDQFGGSVALFGDVALVGAGGDDHDGAVLNAGAAFLFTRTGRVWTEALRLAASDAAAGDEFGGSPATVTTLLDQTRGGSVALGADYAVVGAYRDDDDGTDSGAVYVFDGAGWSQETKLVAPTAGENDWFGSAVAASGDTVVVGAVGREAAYAFVRNAAGNWVLNPQATFTTTDTTTDFGIAVAIDGDTAVVATRTNAYVYVRDDSTWSFQQRLDPPFANGVDWADVAVSGDTIVVGLPGEPGGGTERGRAVVFVRDSQNAWTQEADLAVPVGTNYDDFGASVAVEGNTVLVGSTLAQDGIGQRPGTVFAFTRSGTEWRLDARLHAFDGEITDFVGSDVALHGDTVVAGAFGDEDAGSQSGSAFVLTRTLLTLDPPLLPAESTEGTPHRELLVARGHVAPVSFAVVGDALPVTGGLDPDSGWIDGMWESPGTHTFTIRVTDACGAVTESEHTVTVNATPQITTTDLLDGVQERPYSVPLLATGGTLPLDWEVVSVPIPGLAIDPATGEFSGSPGPAGRFSVTVRCTDALGVATEQVFPLRIGRVAEVADTRKLKRSLPLDGRRVFELVEGSKLTVRIKVPVREPNPVNLLLEDPSGAPLDLGGVLKSKRDGRVLLLKRFVIAATGRYTLILDPQIPIDDDVRVQVNAAVAPPGSTGGQLTMVQFETQTRTIHALPGSAVTLVVKPAKLSQAIPVIKSVLDAGGNELLGGDVAPKPKGKGIVLKLVVPDDSGHLTVEFDTDQFTTGDVVWKARVRAPAGYRFSLPDLTAGATLE